MAIVIDTREQHPLWTKSTKTTDIITKTLHVGDYSIEGYEDKIAIERKSLMDLFGTLSHGHKRFKKELSKALEYDYFAIVIEGSYSNIINKDFDGSHYSKMKGFIIAKILFTLHIKYKINIFFANNRIEARKIIKEIFDAYEKQIKK